MQTIPKNNSTVNSSHKKTKKSSTHASISSASTHVNPIDVNPKTMTSTTSKTKKSTPTLETGGPTNSIAKNVKKRTRNRKPKVLGERKNLPSNSQANILAQDPQHKKTSKSSSKYDKQSLNTHKLQKQKSKKVDQEVTSASQTHGQKVATGKLIQPANKKSTTHSNHNSESSTLLQLVQKTKPKAEQDLPNLDANPSTLDVSILTTTTALSSAKTKMSNKERKRRFNTFDVMVFKSYYDKLVDKSRHKKLKKLNLHQNLNQDHVDLEGSENFERLPLSSVDEGFEAASMTVADPGSHAYVSKDQILNSRMKFKKVANNFKIDIFTQIKTQIFELKNYLTHFPENNAAPEVFSDPAMLMWIPKYERPERTLEDISKLDRGQPDFFVLQKIVPNKNRIIFKKLNWLVEKLRSVI